MDMILFVDWGFGNLDWGNLFMIACDTLEAKVMALIVSKTIMAGHNTVQVVACDTFLV
jgi:hypothetical protein